ncbi:ATP synthase subunit C lysine N-methyltransferase [Belonocnema kinseyi]|uniref:ATP synthase subunit C lysine N-methyltransferase n=1 Tax=Belonocnema kinseyi TaxID=2817044 RepID=UPI00143E0026|nr:ATP synthase subunit C lysine N-methyltransferase [Belonocnema kinseyi]XP_033210098.1 ATP synthase subunit C lysine N-methyltransferase [Belonocnema kinseyi]XP_033210099.1 ATP synthase subunit C lysine N-methyltransferase [Belonocnema kinseyi]
MSCELTSNANHTKSSKWGLFFVSVTGGLATVLSVICIPFVSPALRKVCLPYVPATTKQVDNIINALSGRKGTLIDLGSGDGRIVLAAAKTGFRAYGVELNPFLVAYSKMTALTQGLSSNASFFRGDLWKCNLANYSNVVIFGVSQMMTELESKFRFELETNTFIIACRFPLPNSKPLATIGHGIDTVWVYKMPLENIDS